MYRSSVYIIIVKQRGNNSITAYSITSLNAYYYIILLYASKYIIVTSPGLCSVRHTHNCNVTAEKGSMLTQRRQVCRKLTRDFFRGTSGDGWEAAAPVLMVRESIGTEVVPVPTVVIRLSVVLCVEEERGGGGREMPN